MTVPNVNSATAGIALVILAVVTSSLASAEGANDTTDAKRLTRPSDCNELNNCENGQRPIPLYVINPYQVFQSEENGVHYFKGGSGLGYGYPDYVVPQINDSDTQIFVSYPGQSSTSSTSTYYLNTTKPIRQHSRRPWREDQFHPTWKKSPNWQ